jgi:peroxiredoxin Q/BCP
MAQLKAGDNAPDFKAVDDQNKAVRLSDYRGKTVILYFYPKDDTSGCTTQACSFRDAHEQLETRNAVVLGVSPDGVQSHVKFKAKYDLPFTLLVDEDHTLAGAYGAWGEKSMYGRKYMGIIRSQFVIDGTGTIVDAIYKVSPKASVEKALAAIQD